VDTAEMVKTITDACVSGSNKTVYTSFLETAARLESVILDERTRLKAALVSGTYTGGPGGVIAAIDFHTKEVDSQVKAFQDQIAIRRIAIVGRPKAQAQSLLSDNEKIVKEIEDLDAHRAELVAKQAQNAATADATTKKADQDDAGLVAAEQQFTAAADIVRKSFQDRQTLLTELLK
jgi:hypothetical protein